MTTDEMQPWMRFEVERSCSPGIDLDRWIESVRYFAQNSRHSMVSAAWTLRRVLDAHAK